MFSTPPKPLVIAHRGASGHAIENSWHAFSLAVDVGCDGIELDVHVTADGHLVVHHDAELASGVPIAGVPLAEVQRLPLHDDSAIPLLEEVVERLAPQVQLFIEAKSLPASADAALLALIDGAPDPARIHVHAFDHRIIARLAWARPSLSLGVLSVAHPVDPVGPVLRAGASTLWQEHHLIDEALVRGCAGAGIRVIAWTVNRRTDADRLAALGVHGLCGNWPERLQPLAEWA